MRIIASQETAEALQRTNTPLGIRGASETSIDFVSVRPQYQDTSFYRRTGKWLIDLTLASLLLVALLPVLLLIAAAIRLSSRGRIILLQPRIGLWGKPFGFLKFRTMFDGPSGSRLEQHAEELAQTGVLLKPDDDPRVTRIGRFLRRHSLDELPQLVNVIRGEMSLVGPRPVLPFMIEPYLEESRLRSTVLPGLTGYWQIYARSEGTTLGQMLPYDFRYIEQISLLTDLRVLAITLPRIFSGDGAK